MSASTRRPSVASDAENAADELALKFDNLNSIFASDQANGIAASADLLYSRGPGHPWFPPHETPQTMMACRFFSKGYCSSGSLCRFAHMEEGTAAKASPICRFFLKGCCSNGSTCKFTHDGVQVETLGLSLLPQVNGEINTEVNGLACVIGTGGEVISLTAKPTHQSCRVCMNGLTAHIKDYDIVRALSKIGVIVDQSQVVRRHESYAYVTSTDPKDAALMCERLNGTELAEWISPNFRGKQKADGKAPPVLP